MAYRSYRLRLLVFYLAVVLVGLGGVLTWSTDSTRVACERHGGDATCRVRREAAFGGFDERIAASAITPLEVATYRGKSLELAELALVTPAMHGGRIPLVGRSTLSDAPSAATAHEMQRAFEAFQAGKTDTFEARFGARPGSVFAMTLLAILFVAVALSFVVAELLQLRRIVAVVDEARETLSVRGHEVPFGEIVDIETELGPTRLAIGKDEAAVRGRRLVVVRRDGGRVPLSSFRYGPPHTHAAARDGLLRAIGKVPRGTRATNASSAARPPCV